MKPAGPMGQRFVDLADLRRDEVVALLELAQRLQEHPEPQALAGKILGLDRKSVV